MTDLMQAALHTMERVHATLRTSAHKGIAITRLTSRAHELLTIEQALTPLATERAITILQVDTGECGNQPVQILARMTVLPDHYCRAADLLREAGLTCYTPTIWRHPAGWALLAHWPDPDHANRAIQPDEVAA